MVKAERQIMDAYEAIRVRHSVRAFSDEPIDPQTRTALQAEVERCNEEGNLHMELAWDEPRAFDSTLAHYGKFSNVCNYLIVAGPAGDGLEERGGYYGERVVLLAQQLGINSCWVALTFKKRLVKKMLRPGDKLVLVVALGHGATQGVPHKSKEAAKVSKVPEGTEPPAWFERGVEAALLAPTAVNQQKFTVELLDQTSADGRPVVRLSAGSGPNALVDLGIVRLHFEIGANRDNFAWVTEL